MTSIKSVASESIIYANSVLIHDQLPTHLIEKVDRHIQKAEPILANLMTPYAAFKAGCDEAIAGYIKLGQETKIKSQLLSGPQNRTIETEKMEQILKAILDDFKSVSIVEEDKQYFVCVNGIYYSLDQLLKGVNFNHIQLSAENLNSYETLLTSGDLLIAPELDHVEGVASAKDFLEADKDHLFGALTYAEKAAINIYTGDGFIPMNVLLRGYVKWAVLNFASGLDFDLNRLERLLNIPVKTLLSNDDDNFLQSYIEKNPGHFIKETLLHIAVAVSGLNKLPDHSSLGADQKPLKYVYRFEGMLPEEVLNKRIEAAKQGDVLWEMGFLSTSLNHPGAELQRQEETREEILDEVNLDLDPSQLSEEIAQEELPYPPGSVVGQGIMIKYAKGKYVAPLSQHPDEREVLFPPTQVQWCHHKEIDMDDMPYKMNLFLARAVTTPDNNVNS